jgi:putative DNA primase/helicase
MTIYGTDYEDVQYDEDGNAVVADECDNDLEGTFGGLLLAGRLVKQYGRNLRHTRELGWFGWDGRYWAPDKDGAPERAVVDIVRQGYAGLPDVPEHQRKRMYETLVRGTGGSGIRDILSIAGVLNPVTTCSETLDADPWLVNLPTGTLDLHSGVVRDHRREDMITKMAGAGIGERSILWEEFLARVLPDEAVRSYVQRVCGYALLGQVTEHIMPIFTGVGANGKGTFRDAVMSAFGDYALEVDPALLMEQKHARHGTFKMELRGRRLIFCSETERGARFSESTMKTLTGGDPIQANRMHRDPITFDPSHTLIMMTNFLPSISGDDEAVWRRVHVVPWDVVIPPEERDGGLPERLRLEAPGIMRWIYDGWVAYQEQGLNPPDEVRLRTEAYRNESDALGRFFTERLTRSQMAKISAPALYEAWAQWCLKAGEDAGTDREFRAALDARGQAKKKTKTGIVYLGITLAQEAPEQDPLTL